MAEEQTNGLMDFFRSGLIATMENMWAGFPGNVLIGGQEIWKLYGDIFVQPEEVQWSNMLDMFVQGGLLNEEAKENYMKLKDLGHPLDWVYYILIILMLVKSHIDATTWATSSIMRQELNSQLSPEIPYFGDLINAAFIAPEKTGEIRDLMKRQGYSEESIDLAFLARYRLYNEQIVRDLYLRGVLDTDGLYERMRELGYTDTRTKEIVQTWEVIPSPQDLIYLVGKEAFEPDSIDALGLDDEYPTEVQPWFEKQGLSEYWARKFWAAHWSPPSLEMGFEMYQRDVIDRDTLEFLFRTVEVPPFFRDKLMQIAYSPYTRVDVRRMNDLGVVNDEELVTAYRHLGYDAEKAEKMAEFTVRYNSGAEKELTKGEILTAYEKFVLNENETIEALVSIGYSEAKATLYIDLEDRARAAKYEEAMLKAVKEEYIDNRVSKLQAEDWLGKMNYPAKYTQLELELWELERLRDSKKPSKTDLDKFLKAKIIDKDTYKNELRNLGYGAQYIDWYTQLATGKK